MDLTPVTIRGRKRKHQALVAAQLQHSRSSLETQNREAQNRKRKIKKKTTWLAMPTLQGLPQELLEHIFLYSMNIALPRSSPSLGRRLSSRHITLEFTMRAFFNTMDHRTNIRFRKSSSHPLLQSEILSCRFFTYNFFLAYVHRAHDAMIRLRGKAWKNTSVPVPSVEQFDGLWAFKFTKIPFLSFAPGFFVPEKLLHGPYTKDKASLLYVLVSFSGEIDWRGSIAGEIAKNGIKDAVKEGNEHAVAALSVLLGVPKAITTDLLRYAVLKCGCDLEIMRHLLFNAQILGSETSKDVLDFHDPQLWAWADANGDKGTILKHMLRQAEGFSLEFYFDEHTDWTKIVGFPYGASRFDTRTAFNALVRELLKNLYINYGRKITMRRRQPSPAQGLAVDEAELE